MFTSCQDEVNHDDVIPMWCSCNTNTNDIMPHQSYVVILECEPHNIMLMWLTLHANPNDAMSGMQLVCMHMVKVPR